MNYIEEHLIKKILSTTVDQIPFDHVFIENIFPNDFYEKLVNNLPNISEYTAIKDTGTVGQNYSSERYIINFEQNIKFENIIFTDLYNNLVSLLTSKKLFNTVSNHFINSIKNRIENFSEKEKEKFGISDFKFDNDQVEKSMRKIGRHKGYAEYLFYR